MADSTAPSPVGSRPLRLTSWLRALRLPFYPMSWLGYTAGSSLVIPLPDLLKVPAYWWGYVVVFLIEALTVFLNDLHDFESDRRNTTHGGFTGGSRVLVEGLLTPCDLKRGCGWAAAGAAVSAAVLLAYSPASPGAALVCLGTALVLGVGYTLPPLKFSHRGVGELTVAFAHSLLVVQAGMLVVGGRVYEPAVFEIGLPLFFAVIPSISLSGLPDLDADKAAGKSTLVVKLGIRPVAVIASGSALSACLFAFLWSDRWPSWTLVAMAIHAILVISAALSLCPRPESRRIDGVMIASLSYVLWFPTVPLLAAASF